MVNSVSFDSEFSKRLVEIDGSFCGVLLGGTIDTTECLFLSLQIPRDDECTNFNSSSFESIKDIDIKWVGSYCKNLSRMIPGGVRISGVCLSLDANKFNDHSVHIKKILSRTCLDDPCLLRLVSIPMQEKFVLMLDPTTKKFSCKGIHFNEANSSFYDVAIKVRDIFDHWIAFKTHISLSMETCLPWDRKKENILHELQSSIEPYLQSLTNDTQLLVNEHVYEDHEKLFKDSENTLLLTDLPKKSKVSNKAQKRSFNNTLLNTDHDKKVSDKELEKFSFSNIDIVIFGPHFPLWQRASSSSSLDSGGISDANLNDDNESPDSSSSSFVRVNRLILSGRIPGIAYLPKSSTAGQLMQALRQDLVQSLLARLQLLSEELHITNAELEVSRMLLPQRVLVRLPICPTLPLSDYKFISETTDDVINRLVYFCLPLGITPSGDSETGVTSVYDTGDVDLINEYDLSKVAQSKFLYAGIDASCLDTTLEKSVEVGADDEFSDSEMVDQVVEPVPSSSRLPSNFVNLVLITISVLMLFVGLFIARQEYASVRM